MCGIAGFQGHFSPALLTDMAAAVAHRGPDGQGTTVQVAGPNALPTGLAHRRLSIIDLSTAANQPMTVHCAVCSASGLSDLALTYNGELYNYRELRAGLENRGHVFRSASDSEVLLHLYAERGPDILKALNGIFAFGIYDGRETGRAPGIQRGDLFVARDHLGVKPLYYAETRKGFLFASELKAILRCTDVDRELDVEALHYHLAYLWTPAPLTLLRSVRKLGPGHAAIIRSGRIDREWAHYELPYEGRTSVESEEILADQVYDAVRRAVERQMVSDVPVGAFLSGGLDSSAVVAMMRRLRPDDRIQCYTIAFDSVNGLDGTPHDLPYAQLAARHLGVDLNVVRIEPDMLGGLERMLYHLDEPQADPAPINALLIAERARDDGIKVLLSGAGGDDVFSGYRRHQILWADRALRVLPLVARRPAAQWARRSAAGTGDYRRGRFFRKAVKLLEHSDFGADEKLAAHFWWSGDLLRRSLYTASLAERVASVHTAAPLVQSLRRIPEEKDALNRMLFLEAKHFLADHNLNYTDKMGMAAGVEVRVPLLDVELVELATRVPSRFKQKGREGKAIFKRSMRRELPPEIVYRPKTGFGAPIRHWLNGSLGPIVEDALSPESLANRGLFDARAVSRLRRLTKEGRVDGTYTIFALVCVELWCRMFVDSHVASSPGPGSPQLLQQTSA